MRHFAIPALTLCLALLLAACPATGGSLAISPTSATVTAAGAAVTFTATLAAAGATFSWSLAGPGTLSAATGQSTEYTPPASVPGETIATVTVTSGGLSRSATITIEPAAVINVAGKVVDMVGTPLAGIQVLIEDATGPKTPVLSTAAGIFTVNGVVAPYQVSVTAPGGSDLLQQTWSGVTRINPQIVMSIDGSGSVPEFCPSGNGRIDGTITPAVAAGNTATVYYISSSLSTQDIATASDDLTAGAGTYDIFAFFDTVACFNTASGKLVYVESDGAGNVVRTASVDNVFVQRNNNVSTTVNLVTGPAQTATLSGSVALPPGLGDATIMPAMSFNGALALLDPVVVSAAAPDFSVDVPVIAGIQYRVVALKDGGGTNTRWYWSDVVSAGQSGISLELDTLSEQLSPSGSTPDATPTFTFEPVEGSNLYTAYLTDGTDVMWIGMSNEPSITLPQLSPPAQLVGGGSYQWATITLEVHDAAGVDDLLDGRMVDKALLGAFGINLPSEVRSGTVNANFANFSIP